MSVESHSIGHKIYFDDKSKTWKFKDNGKVVNHERACSKCGEAPVTFESEDGKKYHVDDCIAPIVEALNKAGIKTVASCCGHHDPLLSSIILDDDRVICVFDKNIWLEFYKKNNIRTGQIYKKIKVNVPWIIFKDFWKSVIIEIKNFVRWIIWKK